MFAVDEKTAIQALDRFDPVFAAVVRPGQRHGFEYHRHGTLSLYAALEYPVRERCMVQTATAAYQRRVRQLPRRGRRPVGRRDGRSTSSSIISSTHKTQAVRKFLTAHPRVRIHFTPTYSVVAQSSGTLVRQDRARRARSRHLHLGGRISRRRIRRSSGTTTRMPNRSVGTIAIRRIELVNSAYTGH